jgi:hypothetical protein
MSTIDDLAFARAKLVADHDLKLFGPPEEDLSRYLRAKAWHLEEAVALGLGYHPHNLSISVIREKCPEQIDLSCKGRTGDLRPLPGLFMDRCKLLEESTIFDDIDSKERGGKLWFKPADLATYARKEWASYMPSSARALMDAAVLDADTGFANNSEKEEATAPAAATEAAPAAFLGPASTNAPADGAVGPQEGHSSAWNLIESETCKPIDERQFKRRTALKARCAELGAGDRAFERLYEKAEGLPGFIRFKKGRPSNSK